MKKISKVFTNIIKGKEDASLKKRRRKPHSRVQNRAQNTPVLNDELSHKFNKILSNQSLIETGQVKLLGLNRLRKRLDDKWPLLKNKIHGSLTTIVERRIAKDDVFFSRSEDEFYIIFSSTNHDVAQLICAKILEELTEKFAGPTDTKDIVVKTAVQQVKGEILFQSKDLKSMLEEVHHSEDNSKDVNKKDGISITNTRLMNSPDKPYYIGYKAAWNSKNEVITTYMVNACLSTKGNMLGVQPTGYDVLGDNAMPADMIALDHFVLSTSIEELEDLFQNSFRSIFCIPVCYETLFNTELLVKYSTICKKIPKFLQKYVVFSLVNFPSGIPTVKLHFIISTLKQYCSAVVFKSAEIDLPLNSLKDCGINVIEINLSDHGKNSEKTWDVVMPLVQGCHYHKIQVLVNDIDTLEDLLLARKNYVDYVTGKTIGKYSDIAGHMKRLPWKELLNTL